MVSRRTTDLPDKFYLIKSDGCYYSMKDGVASVSKTKPDKSCEVTVEYLPSDPDQFYLRNSQGCYFQYHKTKKGHIDHSPTKKKRKIPKRPIEFIMLDCKEPDTYAFRASNGQFLVLEVNEKNRVTLGSYESDSAKIKIGDPTIIKRIGGIAYTLESSVVTNIRPPISALKTTVRNDSQSVSNQSLTYEYTKYHKGSWVNDIGVTLEGKGLAGAKIPEIVDGSIVAIQSKAQVDLFNPLKKETSSVSIPPCTWAVATIQVYYAKIQVPFTYKEEIWYQSGEHKIVTKHGVYDNTVHVAVDLELTDLTSINHTFHHI